LRAKTAKEFTELYAEYMGGHTVKPEEVNCSGCQSESGLFIGCELCPIRKCCREKKFTTCTGCIDFQQCEMLNGFYSIPAHKQAKENLDNLRA
jgi:hypothetical protein